MADRDRDERASAPTRVERPSSPDADAPRRPSRPARTERFEERGELGRGGMGRVVEAFDHALGRTVAIKQVFDASDIALARFEREAQITARLEHPGIVPVHDIGRGDDGTPYYVMKRIDGDPLSELVADKPFAARITLVPNVLAACDACAYAHAHDVIHRDIKPTNILVGAFGETMLIDWGIARTIGESSEASAQSPSDPALTVAGSVAGTPGFMAPEQARGEKLDARVDVFALGTTLFYVLAGAHPFGGSSATEMIDHVGANRPPDWRKLPEETPPELRAIVEKAMAAKREDRYADAGALAADLRRYVTGQLVGAYEYGAWDQLRRFVRRHRAVLGVLAISVAVIAVVAIFSVRRILAERDEARTARGLAEHERQAALDMSDELLVQNALKLAATDPAAAIATLRRLPLRSKQWGRAEIVASLARLNGIPIGFSVGPPGMTTIEVSPEGTWIAVLPLRTGALELIELKTRKRTPVAGVTWEAPFVWFDNRTLVHAKEREVTLLDAETHAMRKIVAPSRVRRALADGASTAWIVTDDRKLYELKPSTAEFGPPILDQVADIEVIGPGAIAVARASSLDVWRGGLHTVVREGRPDMVVAGSDRIAARYGDEVCTWRAGDTVTPQPCISAGPTRGVVGVEREAVWIMGGGQVEAHYTNGMVFRYASGGAMRSVPGGFVFSTPSEVRLHAHGHHRVVAQHDSMAARLAASADGRVLAGVTATGVLFVWDLSALAPRSIPTGQVERFIGLTAAYVVLSELGGPFVLVDRTTGERIEIKHAGATLAATSADREWVLAFDPPGLVQAGSSPAQRHIVRSILHLPTRKVIEIAEDEVIAIASEGEVWSLREGQISRLHSSGARTPIARLDAATGIDGAVDVIALRTGASEVCRIILPSTAASCVPIAGVVSEFVVDYAGVIWILVEGHLLRWSKMAATPIAVLPDVSFATFTRIGRKTTAVGAQSLVDLGSEPLKPIPLKASLLVQSASGERVLAMARSKLSIIDVGEGVSFSLPFEATPFAAPSIEGSTVAIGHPGRVDLHDIAVPTEPAALKAWLDQVTNATPIEGSDALAWP